MFGIATIGATLVCYATKELYRMNPTRTFKRIVEASLHTHKICQEGKKVTIKKIKKEEYGYSYTVSLPSGTTIEKFLKVLPALEQDTSSKIRFHRVKGRTVQLDFGLSDLLTNINYSHSLPRMGLTVPFFTYFGIKSVNFWEESCWHFLIAGATGMGKSFLLRYLLTHLFLTRKGSIHFYICSNKITDFRSYQNIPQFSLAKTVDDLMDTLFTVIEEAKRRESLLSSHNALDVRELRDKHKLELSPIFLVIDEYGRISEVEEAQLLIQEIIETYRYVDVHVIISTQRPDATSAMKPRIRANILGSLALSVRDESNSRMIVGTGEAAVKKLGGIKGRGILLDGLTYEVQVPYLSDDTLNKLLEPYRSEEDEQKRCGNRPIPEEIPRIIEEPTGEIVFRGKQKPSSRRKPSHEATKPRGKSYHRPATKRPVLPIYAEPDYDTSKQHKD
jgi:hypothetical protein